MSETRLVQVRQHVLKQNDLAARAQGLAILERTVNGQPGLIVQQDGVTVAVYAFEIAGEKIARIWAILDPGKLRPWATA